MNEGKEEIWPVGWFFVSSILWNSTKASYSSTSEPPLDLVPPVIVNSAGGRRSILAKLE